jgi:hypothetical protein
MGHPDGAHTHGSGGGGFGDILTVAGVILILAAVAGPVTAAVGALVHVLLITAALLLGLAGVALVGFIAWRVHRYRHPDGARDTALPPGAARAAQPLPQPRRAAAGQAPAIEQHIHHHWHGVTPEDVAAIIRRQETPARSAIEDGK